MTLIVNGEKIGDSLIEQEYQRLEPHYKRTFPDQAEKEQRRQLLEWSKENVVEKKLLEQEARRQFPDISNSEIEQIFEKVRKEYSDRGQNLDNLSDEAKKTVREEIKTHRQIEKLLEKIHSTSTEPAEKDIQQFYQEHKDQFKSPETAKVAHIVKYINWQADEEQAHKGIEAAAKQIEQSGSFEIAADEHTDCGDAGGYLGHIRRGQMVEEFEDVIFNLEPGQTSRPFRTRYGWHIAKVYDKKLSETASLEDARQTIIEQLKGKKLTEAVEAYVDTLKEKASIKETTSETNKQAQAGNHG